MRLRASSILRISLRSRSRVRSSRLNSSSWVARSFGSGKLAASSFMCETVRSTSTIRSRFQLLRMLRKCSSCSLLMYCSPRLTMYGCTLRGPASRLPGSSDSPSSASALTGAGRGAEGTAEAVTGSARARGFLISISGWGAAVTAGFLGATAVLRTCALTGRGRAPSGLRASGLRAGGRLTGFLPFADFGAGFLAAIKDSSESCPASLKNARLYRRTWGCTVPQRGVNKALKWHGSRPADGPAHGAGRLPAGGDAASGQRHRGRGLPLRLSALRDNGGVDAAAHVEARRQAQKARRDCGLQMIGDLIGDRLVEGAAIAERPDVELQRLQLHALRIRDVLQLESRKVRLAGARAQAGEFRDLHADGVVARDLRIRKGLQLMGGRCRHIPLHYTIL